MVEATKDAEPMEGGLEFYKWLARHYQVLIVSDMFYPLVGGILEKMGNPTMLCHNLEADEEGYVSRHIFSSINSKQNNVEAMQGLNFEVVAVGDSFNDLTMLKSANTSFFFNPSEQVVEQNPDIPVANTYEELKKIYYKQNILLGFEPINFPPAFVYYCNKN